MDPSTALMTNRSLRIIHAELYFLVESSALTPSQHASILSNLPSPRALPNTPATLQSQERQSTSSQVSATANTQHNTKDEHSSYYAPQQPSPAPSPNPPTYNNSFVPPPPPQGPPILAHASALYAYVPADAGDLALASGDRVAVLEYMNADWAKGRNERTGLEGIFPRAYVSAEDRAPGPQVQHDGPTSYGNLPLAVSQGDQNAVQQQGQPGQPSKVNETGKKFGKKLGNAAIFGAGATIGSNIVNGIF